MQCLLAARPPHVVLLSNRDASLLSKIEEANLHKKKRLTARSEMISLAKTLETERDGHKAVGHALQYGLVPKAIEQASVLENVVMMAERSVHSLSRASGVRLATSLQVRYPSEMPPAVGYMYQECTRGIHLYIKTLVCLLCVCTTAWVSFPRFTSQKFLPCLSSQILTHFQHSPQLSVLSWTGSFGRAPSSILQSSLTLRFFVYFSLWLTPVLH